MEEQVLYKNLSIDHLKGGGEIMNYYRMINCSQVVIVIFMILFFSALLNKTKGICNEGCYEM